MISYDYISGEPFLQRYLYNYMALINFLNCYGEVFKVDGLEKLPLEINSVDDFILSDYTNDSFPENSNFWMQKGFDGRKFNVFPVKKYKCSFNSLYLKVNSTNSENYKMVLSDDYIWAINILVEEIENIPVTFVFDVKGDKSLIYGDTDKDGIAELNGSGINLN